jgi:transposase-like protein
VREHCLDATPRSVKVVSDNTHGEISAHLAEIYGAEVSKQTISAITDRVLEGMAAWQNRPLDPVYPVIFIDCVNVKIRDGNVANRPIYVALAVTCEGTRDILGLWAGEHGDGEGAKYWMRVLSEIKNRGTQDCLIVVCDGLKGLPEAIGQVSRRVVPPPRRGRRTLDADWCRTGAIPGTGNDRPARSRRPGATP